MNTKFFTTQLDELLHAFESMQRQAKHNDLSDLPKSDRQSLVTRSIAAVHRISGLHSTYSIEVERLIKREPDLHLHTSSILGVIQALKDDLKQGYLQSITEIIHSEVFSDFLEMSKYLNDSGFKDPAAVLAGSTLESHLKKVALKNEIPIELDNRPIKADKLNSDLVKANVYGLIDQKNVTAWLDLRNKAAHGKYEEYSQEQVKLLIASIQDFITRNPA